MHWQASAEIAMLLQPCDFWRRFPFPLSELLLLESGAFRPFGFPTYDTEFSVNLLASLAPFLSCPW